jgi:hypothetical protein
VKPRNREVNIFNMSVLDLLTGALGAFCFLTLALFPSYYKIPSPFATEEQPDAEQKRLEKEYGKAKGGVPAFSLVSLVVSDEHGYACGFFKIDDLQAPRGSKSFRQLPFAAGSQAPGYDNQVYVFLFDAGSYHLKATGYSYNSPCLLKCFQNTAQGTRAWEVNLTGSPASYPFSIELKPEQRMTSIIPHR